MRRTQRRRSQEVEVVRRKKLSETILGVKMMKRFPVVSRLSERAGSSSSNRTVEKKNIVLERDAEAKRVGFKSV